MSKLAKALTAAAGNAGESLYVEDVFSTYLYTGDGTSDPFPIVNGIDLANNGGLVWQKQRSSPAQGHILVDTERGGSSFLSSNTTSAATSLDMIDSFNEDGFDLAFNTITNGSGNTYASWTFRKAEKFFDVVTYTGNGVTGRSVSHNLGSVPGVIIVKNLSTSNRSWQVYHESLGITKRLELDSTGAAGTSSHWTNPPTDTEFTVRNLGVLNGSGEEYVAYLFASDAGGFGDDGSENIIKCGSFTGGTDGYATVDLGFEPQWVLMKSSSEPNNWIIYDTMRGWVTSNGSADDAYLLPNTSFAEGLYTAGETNATGFRLRDNPSPGSTYIYIAIRRPMKTPESGTEVFAASTRTGTTAPSFPASFNVVDAAFRIYRPGGGDYARKFGSRLTGVRTLYTSSTAAEAPDSEMNWDYMDGWNSDTGVNTDVFSWMFKRATGFFDVVAYTGDGTYGDLNHNLGVLPEMIIVKRRDGVQDWFVWHEGQGAVNSNQRLNRTNAVDLDYLYFNSTANTVITFRAGRTIYSYLDDYVAYLFASVDGVSKVGSYTGTGSNVDVDCGFSAGARFILIKRTDSTGDWYVWDSERGIVAGNDPYLLLNRTDAEVTNTDYIDPLNAGFTVTSSAPAALNASGGNYIFLAIA